MRSLIRPLLALALVAGCTVTGCTFNVTAFEEVVSGETTETLTAVRVDLSGVAAAFEGADVVVRGAARDGASADVTIAGLVGSGPSADEIASDVRVAFEREGDSTFALRLGYDGPAAESVWIDAIAIEQAIGTSFEANGGSASFDVAGLDAPRVGILAGSGSIRVRDAAEVDLEAGSGSIDVIAATGRLETGSGSIRMVMSSAVIASAGSGSIRGSFGERGQMSAGSGSLELELTTPLSGDVTLETGSGSITLVVPRGAAMDLDLDAGSGSVTVRAGGVSQSGESFRGGIGGGGEFRVHARAGSGSITVREAD